MASDKIKGLTVKIGADTSDFIKELKKVDKEINQTQKTANELQKGLSLEFNPNRFIETQKQLRTALESTEEKAKAIREQLKFLESTGGVNTEGYAKLQTELAKTETKALQLKEQLKDIDKIKFENATKSITNLSKGLETAAKKTAVLSGAAIGAIAGITKLAKGAVETGDQIQTTADQYSMSAEAIQKWNYIALQTDVASEQLYKGVTKVRDAIGTALVGQTNTATEALQALGVSFDSIEDGEDAFYQTVIALSEVKDSTLQAYYANEIFGERIATNLIPLLNQGADGLNELGKEFEAVGYLSNEQVRQLADFDNELNKFNTRMENAKTELGLALLPILERFVDILEKHVIPAIKDLAKWFDSLPEPMQNVITGGLLLFAALSPILFILSKIIGVIPNLIKLFGSLKNATWQTYLGFAALGGAIGLTFDLIADWKQMSIVEQILKSLAVAALVAAAAVTVFHASWSLGATIGVITAAIVAGIAAINAAASDIGVDVGFSDQSSIEGYANQSYNIPTSSGSGNTYNEDYSQYNITINTELTGDLNYDTKTLADSVIKEIVTRKQASGR